MKHAGDASLQMLLPVLTEVRATGAFVEKKPGIFYRKSKPFLHFHKDTAGLFADFKTDGKSYERFRVSTSSEQKLFLKTVRKTVQTM